MPVRTSYTQGTPNWVDLQTSDQDGARAFYSGLFGWTYDDQPMPEGQVYSMAMLGEHAVAAIAPQPPEMAAAGAPPMWNTYLAVDSVDDAAAKVEAAGGKIAMAPFDVMDADFGVADAAVAKATELVLAPVFDTPVGRMAVIADPQGAVFSIIQQAQPTA